MKVKAYIYTSCFVHGFDLHPSNNDQAGSDVTGLTG